MLCLLLRQYNKRQFHLLNVNFCFFIYFQRIKLILVIIPPPPTSLSIPQPALLEEPPIPVGLQIDFQSQQQQYPSIALVLPTNKSDTTDNGKPPEDVSTTLSQQEELSVKGIYQLFLSFFISFEIRS